jgi:hypothetical protein
MTKYRLPDGFTAATTAPNTEDNLEVLFVPYPGDTHFHVSTARFEKGRREGAQWRTIGGDDVHDYGYEVLAWRKQRDEMKVVAAEPKTTDKGAYRRAIDILAMDSIERAMAGERDDRPEGVEKFALLFDVSPATVTEDYKARSTQILAERRR